LRNYREPDCPLPLPPRAWENARGDLRRRALIENLYRYADAWQTPWIHLMDGGISDNLALRVLLNDMLDHGKDSREILTQRRLTRLPGWEIERGQAT
jgi:NTE family protein